jgi:hypothetical protein
MLTNADITLFNAIPGADGPVWRRTYLYGVNWQGLTRASVTDKGLLKADSTRVFVPFSVKTGSEDKHYLKPKKYRETSDFGAFFTFEKGDLVCRGIVDEQLGGEDGITEKELRKRYDDVMTILSVAANDNGSRSMWHWELEAQ